MKTIGKIAALSMTVGLAFALTACGGAASNSAASNTSNTSPSATSASTVSTGNASGASTSASASSNEVADMYTNEYFGLQFDMPEGWSFADKSNYQTGDVGSDAGTKVDMAATSADQKESVIVAVEAQGGPSAGKTAQAVVEQSTNELTESISGGNASYTSSTATITFQPTNKEMPASITTITIDGKSVCTGIAVDEKDGNFIHIVVSAPTEADVNAIFSAFSTPVQ